MVEIKVILACTFIAPGAALHVGHLRALACGVHVATSLECLQSGQDLK